MSHRLRGLPGNWRRWLKRGKEGTGGSWSGLDKRNMTYDDRSARMLVIDFERSSLIERKVLSVLSPNKRRADDLAVMCLKRRSSRRKAFASSVARDKPPK
jgi:hypothetical protein